MFAELGVFVGAGVIAGLGARRQVRRFIVPEGQMGLFYRQGKFVRRLPVGSHWSWGRNTHVQLIDLRESLLQVPGQELVTKDQVQVRVTATVRYRVLDPETALHRVDDFRGMLYLQTQLEARSILAALEIEEALAQRAELDGRLLEKVRPAAKALGVEVTAAAFKDFLLSGELRKTLGEVVQARKAGQAALERARGEVAALRALANAARLMDEHPALAQLRLVQALGPGNTVVMGVQPGLVTPGGREKKEVTT